MLSFHAVHVAPLLLSTVPAQWLAIRLSWAVMDRKFLATFLCTALALDLCVVLSPWTSQEFLPLFSKRLDAQFDTGELRLRTITISDLSREICGLTVDATGDLRAMTDLQVASAEYDISVLSLSPNKKILRRKNMDVFAHDDDFLPFVEITLKHFNWSSLSVLYSPDQFGTELRRTIDEQFVSVQVMITGEEKEDNIKKVILREIKRKGSNIIVIGSVPETVAQVFRTMEEEKMLREGYGFVVIGEAVWGFTEQQWPGLLLIKPADCAYSASAYECDADRVVAIIKRISAALKTPIRDLTADCVKNYLTQHPLSNDAVVVNLRAEGNRIVGIFGPEGDFQQVNPIYFPGNTTTLPKLLLSKVEISFNSGLENPTMPPSLLVNSTYNGQRLAVAEINKRGDILPKQTLVTNDVAFGAVEWNEEWAVPRILANKERLGVAFMAGYASAVATQTLLTFDKYNLSRPCIGSSNTLIELGNSTKYPWFVRNGMSGLYFASLYAKIMSVMGWNRCAVLYGDDGWSSSIYAKFQELAESHKIDIVNNATLRRLPAKASKAELREVWIEHFLELFRCNARLVIVFILEPSPQYILELMFDLGARKGDFIFTGAWMSPSYLTAALSINSMKHRELLEGSVGFYSAVWIGPIGTRVGKKQFIQSNYSDQTFLACYYYDSTFALAYAIDNCLEFGFDYEDPHKLMKCLRETRFVGCSGFVSWLSGENNREFSDYNIFILVRNSTTGGLSERVVGRYRPTSTQVFDFPVPIIFADGTSITPPDLRVVYENCPFEEKFRLDFEDGQKLTIGICVIVFTATAVIAIVIYKKVWSFVVIEMRRSEISLEDVKLMATVGVETFQLACLGPDFRGLHRGFLLLAQVTAVNLSDDFTFSKGVYWLTLDAVFAITGLWVVLNLFTYLRLGERLHNCEAAVAVGNIAHIILPLLGTVCFVPMLSVLLDAFRCEEAIATRDFQHSILLKDCYVHCWQGTHLIYAVFAAIALLVYVPTTLLLLPVWQDFQSTLHIKAYPLFLIVKFLVQVLLTCLAKADRSTGSSIAFACIIAVFTVFCLRSRTHNYGRVALWQILGLVGVFLLSTVALVNNTVGWRFSASIVAAGWAILLGSDYAGIGLWVQHRYLPGLLFRKRGRDFSQLLKFAFTNTVSAREVQPKLNYARDVVEPSDVELRLSS